MGGELLLQQRGCVRNATGTTLEYACQEEGSNVFEQLLAVKQKKKKRKRKNELE